MKVREFIQTLTKEELDFELLIARDEEGNAYHTVDPDITGACIKDSVLLVESKGQMNALILTPLREVEQE